jgi:hypothetical protein
MPSTVAVPSETSLADKGLDDHGATSMHLRRFVMAASALLLLTAACARKGTADPDAGGQAGAAAQGGMATATGGTTGGGGASGAAVDSGSGTTVDSTNVDAGSVDGAAGGLPNTGVCGQRGKATADATSFDGYEEVFIIGDNGFGNDVCAVRFDLKRVGDAPPGCTVCTWTHLLEYSNPSVVTDEGGVCARSELALDAAATARRVGARVAIGFAKELGGAHGSARMRYFESKNAWDVYGNATWDETTKAFKYDNREGVCSYGP